MKFLASYSYFIVYLFMINNIIRFIRTRLYVQNIFISYYGLSTIGNCDLTKKTWIMINLMRNNLNWDKTSRKYMKKPIILSMISFSICAICTFNMFILFCTLPCYVMNWGQSIDQYICLPPYMVFIDFEGSCVYTHLQPSKKICFIWW